MVTSVVDPDRWVLMEVVARRESWVRPVWQEAAHCGADTAILQILGGVQVDGEADVVVDGHLECERFGLTPMAFEGPRSIGEFPRARRIGIEAQDVGSIVVTIGDEGDETSRQGRHGGQERIEAIRLEDVTVGDDESCSEM